MNTDCLQPVQNALARIVRTAPYRAPATGLRKSLHWLPSRQPIIDKIVTFTFKVRVRGQSVYLADLIVDLTPYRALRFSGKDLLVVPGFKTQFPAKAFRDAAPRTWNDLSAHVRSATSASSFRKQLKTHLFDVAYTINHHGLSRRLRLAVSTKTYFVRAAKYGD